MRALRCILHHDVAVSRLDFSLHYCTTDEWSFILFGVICTLIALCHCDACCFNALLQRDASLNQADLDPIASVLLCFLSLCFTVSVFLLHCEAAWFCNCLVYHSMQRLPRDGGARAGDRQQWQFKLPVLPHASLAGDGLLDALDSQRVQPADRKQCFQPRPLQLEVGLYRYRRWRCAPPCLRGWAN